MNQNLQAILDQRIQQFARDIVGVLQDAVNGAVAESLGASLAGAPRAAKVSTTNASKKVKAPKAAKAAKVPGAAKGPAKAAKKSGARSKKGGKRTVAELEKVTEALLREVKSNGGRRIEQIGKSMGLTTKDLALPMKKLLSDKSVRSKGNRRSTTYTAA